MTARKVLALFELACFAICLSGCTRQPRLSTDKTQRAESPQTTAIRVVSLAPSITEILNDLHATSCIVGVTTADRMGRLPSQVHSVGTLLQPSREAILACNPQLVIAVQGMADVSGQWLKSAHIKLLLVPDGSLEDVFRSILQIGASVNRLSLARRLVRKMQAEISAVRFITSALQPPRVLPIYQMNPLYTSANTSFVADAIRAAGGGCLTSGVSPTGETTPEVIVQYQPDVILCDKRIAHSAVNQSHWLAKVPAVHDNHWYWLNNDREALVRPTPRLAVAIAHLACYLHPRHAAAITHAILHIDHATSRS